WAGQRTRNDRGRIMRRMTASAEAPPSGSSSHAAPAGPAIVVGVGPGLGWSLCRAFARAGHRVLAAGRRVDAVEKLAAAGPSLAVPPIACDATDAASVHALVERAAADGPPAIAVHNASSFVRGNVLDLDPAELEQAWRLAVMGGLHLAQAAGRRMVA